jgi:hypothetical protein
MAFFLDVARKALGKGPMFFLEGLGKKNQNKH